MRSCPISVRPFAKSDLNPGVEGGGLLLKLCRKTVVVLGFRIDRVSATSAGMEQLALVNL